MAQTLEQHETYATMGENACAQLSIEQVIDMWPQFVVELRKISHVWDKWWTEEALREQVVEGCMQVWVAGPPPSFHIVVFTQILPYPAGSIFQAVLMFGTKIDKVLPVVVATLEHFAQEQGCSFAEVVGRSGWKWKLESFGYKDTASILSKPLETLRRQ